MKAETQDFMECIGILHDSTGQTKFIGVSHPKAIHHVYLDLPILCVQCVPKFIRKNLPILAETLRINARSRYNFIRFKPSTKQKKHSGFAKIFTQQNHSSLPFICQEVFQIASLVNSSIFPEVCRGKVALQF